MQQVRRCKAKQDDGLINPATPKVQWEKQGRSHSGSVTWKLLRAQHKLCANITVCLTLQFYFKWVTPRVLLQYLSFLIVVYAIVAIVKK